MYYSQKTGLTHKNKSRNYKVIFFTVCLILFTEGNSVAEVREECFVINVALYFTFFLPTYDKKSIVKLVELNS